MKKFYLVLSLIIAVLVLTACNNEQRAEEQKEIDKSLTYNNGEFQEFDYATYQSKDSPHIKITYPVFKSNKINDKITEYREHVTNDFKHMINDENEKNTLDIKVSSEKIEEGIFLFNVTKKIALGETDSFARHHAAVINTKTNNIAVADHFFDLEENKRTELFEMLDEEIRKDGSIAPYYQPEKLENLVMDKNSEFKNIGIKNNQVAFHFDGGEIGLPAMGTPTVSLNVADIIELTEPSLYAVITNSDGKKEEKEEAVVEEEPDEFYKERDLNAEDKMVALTFDDGPQDGTTERVLNILDDYQAKATFFMLGRSIENFPNLATEVDRRGHEIGNHSYTHADMLTLSIEGVQQEVNDTTALIEAYTNQTPKFFRPPYGSFNDDYAQGIPLETAYWSVDTEDWLTHDKDMILNEIKQSTVDGSVVLMHDIHEDTVNSLESVIQYLQSEGFKFVTISELKKYKGDYVSEMR